MKRLLTLLLALSVLFLSFGAASEAQKNYLALGDSITSHFALNEGEKHFAEIVAEEMEYEFVNYAVVRYKAENVHLQFEDPAFCSAVGEADIITITCGGNDLLDGLYLYIAEIYNDTVPDRKHIRAQDVSRILSSPAERRFVPLLLAAQRAIGGNERRDIPPFSESDEIRTVMAEYERHMNAILSNIRDINPQADILITTQYNPYLSFAGLLSGINAAIETGVQLLNASVVELAGRWDCRVVDLYEVFSASGENLSNASVLPVNLDFHPNAEGHRVIAGYVIQMLNSIEE